MWEGACKINNSGKFIAIAVVYSWLVNSFVCRKSREGRVMKKIFYWLLYSLLVASLFLPVVTLARSIQHISSEPGVSIWINNENVGKTTKEENGLILKDILPEEHSPQCWGLFQWKIHRHCWQENYIRSSRWLFCEICLSETWTGWEVRFIAWWNHFAHCWFHKGRNS